MNAFKFSENIRSSCRQVGIKNLFQKYNDKNFQAPGISTDGMIVPVQKWKQSGIFILHYSVSYLLFSFFLRCCRTLMWCTNVL